MTDPDLLAKKLAFIETCVRELETLARPELIEREIKERRFVEHTLQVAVQAALDVCSHIVSDQRLGEPRTNRELFRSLAQAGWFTPQLATRLEAAASFRNIVVHGYGDVNLDVVRDIAENRLGDLTEFVLSVRKGLEGS